MSRWPLKVKVAAGFAVGFLGLACAVGIAWRSMNRLLRSSEAAAREHEVLAEVRTAFSLLQDVELGVRGYLLTGDEASLKPYRSALIRLEGQIQKVRWLASSGTPRQVRLVGELQGEAAASLSWSESTIASRREGPLDGPRAAAAVEERIAQMEKIRRTLARLEEESNRNLFARPAKEGSELTHTLIVLSVGALLPFAMLLAVYWVIQREARARARQIAERKETEAQLLERAHQALFGAEVGAALTKAETLPRALGQCAEAMVRHLDAAMASVWILSKDGKILELQGSAWARRPLFGPNARVPVGEFRIGEIARDRKPALHDLTAGPEREDDKDWARREGMVALAGYPLIVRERLVGVMAMFAQRPLTEAALTALASVADEIALGIDRALAGEELAASEARNRAVLDNMLEGLLSVDERTIIRTVNPAAEQTFGYRAEELIGKPLAVLVPEHAGPDPLAFLKQAQRRALGKITRWEGRRKNGEVFPFELALFEFHTAEGRRFAGSIRDISESREVERLKKEFVSTVSHELRTPLTSIRGSLGLLAGGVLGPLEPEASEVVAVAERNVVRLVRLINDILDLERYDSGRIEMRFERVAVASLFQRSLEVVRAFANEEGVELEWAGSSAEVWADGDRIVQVLVNLVSNAVKFSPRGGAVRISASEGDGWVEVRVADRGRGIPASFREAIFERFRQVESSDARRKGGSGLGLAICKAIVEQHRGSIGVESEERQGSVFWFRMPTRPPEEQQRETVPVLLAAAGAAATA